MTKKGKNSVYVYAPSDAVLEGLVELYTDYVTNPYSEVRQRDVYFEMKYLSNEPLPLEYRALRYKDTPDGEETVVENLPKPQHDATYVQFVVLMDTLYRKCYLGYDKEDEEGYRPSVSASILKEISEHYAYVLKVLEFEAIISGNTYTHIEIRKPEIFRRTERKNQRVVNKINSLRAKAYAVWKKRMTIAKKNSTDFFVDRYNQSLLSYRLDVDKAVERISEDRNMDEQEKENKIHRTYSLSEVIGTEFGCLDDAADINGRWYHVGTQTLRIVRPFTNIRFIVDARNSQLVLFNYFLLAYYLNVKVGVLSTFSKFTKNTLLTHLAEFINGPERRVLTHEELESVFTSDRRRSEIRRGFRIHPEYVQSLVGPVKAFRDHPKAFSLISEFIAHSYTYSTPSNHLHHTRSQYVSKEICKVLMDNGFKGAFLGKISSIPTNVRRYIYQTCNGVFWDEFMKKTGMDRDTVKKAVFRNIFYSFPQSRVEDASLRDMFKKEFPDVYKVLTFYKKKFKADCDQYGLDMFTSRGKGDKGRAWGDKYNIKVKSLLTLSHKETQLESAIFHDILNELFQNKKLRVIGIHDAVAVLNDEITPEEVVDVMKRGFAKYGMYASFKVEYMNGRGV